VGETRGPRIKETRKRSWVRSGVVKKGAKGEKIEKCFKGLENSVGLLHQGEKKKETIGKKKGKRVGGGRKPSGKGEVVGAWTISGGFHRQTSKNQ